MTPTRALLALLLTACAEAPTPPDATGTLADARLPSALLGQELILRWRLPPGYDPDGRYPLVVQLDPSFVGQQLAWTTGLVSELAASGDLPEAIVLGVDYDDPYDRFRDYTNEPPLDPAFTPDDGADRFYAVLRDEVLPHAAATHAVDPDHTVLLGHSNGAQFAWYAAFRHDPAAPPPFSGLVAADGGLPQEQFTYERWHAERAEDLPVALYATRATLNGPLQEIAFDAMIDRLAARAYPSLDLAHATLETDHGGAIAPTYEAGLRHVLGGAR